MVLKKRSLLRISTFHGGKSSHWIENHPAASSKPERVRKEGRTFYKTFPRSCKKKSFSMAIGSAVLWHQHPSDMQNLD